MNSNGCPFDFDMKDQRIALCAPATNEALRKFEAETKTKLPASYNLWMSGYSDGVVIDIGNLIEVLPLYGEYSVHMFFGAESPIQLPEGLMPFASGGCGEIWSFYTKQRFRDGEYPVVWVDPGSVGDDAYVYCNSSFDRFLNINIPFLVHGDNEEELPLEQASDPDIIAKADEEANEIWRNLYERYERGLSFDNYDMFPYATSYIELEKQIAVECAI